MLLNDGNHVYAECWYNRSELYHCSPLLHSIGRYRIADCIDYYQQQSAEYQHFDWLPDSDRSGGEQWNNSDRLYQYIA